MKSWFKPVDLVPHGAAFVFKPPGEARKMRYPVRVEATGHTLLHISVCASHPARWDARGYRSSRRSRVQVLELNGVGGLDAGTAFWVQ